MHGPNVDTPFASPFEDTATEKISKAPKSSRAATPPTPPTPPSIHELNAELLQTAIKNLGAIDATLMTQGDRQKMLRSTGLLKEIYGHINAQI